MQASSAPLGQEHHISELLTFEELLEVGQQQGLAAGAHTSLLAGSRLDQAMSKSWFNSIEIIPPSTETRDRSVLGRSEKLGCLCLSLVILVLPPELDRQGAIIGGEKILHTGEQLSLSILILFRNKTKVISADLLDFDFDFEDITMLCNISVLVTFQFWCHFSFDKLLVLRTIVFW